MTHNILIIDGHPDPTDGRFVHALANEYRDGAQREGHDTTTIRVADLQFPWLRSQQEFEHGEPPESIRDCQHAMERATHVVILYPLWLGSMPAALKALLEQVLRPDFTFSSPTPGRLPKKFLGGRTARIVVTMGMPTFVYRWYYRAHSVRSLERNILKFVGFSRVRTTFIGDIAGLSKESRERWRRKIRSFGAMAN
jgi:putative NADPH-quinone reductase